ncbi:MAG: hypothetical protein CVU35_07405 [Betaproteobacteria bacterium HGW-Betaproteobacteria-8]|nr:MAG: hypothetical protein CVU35_07405 [Betaproteobacteria bacterium HGW-Betaproteobacteria-8]
MTENQSEVHWMETYKSLITLSIEAFRFSALANGGAAVALLAYLGSVASSSDSVVINLSCPMLAYISGLVLCGLAVLFGYLTQLKLLNEIGRSQRLVVKHTWYLWAAIVFYLASLIAFAWGSYLAVLQFNQ